MSAERHIVVVGGSHGIGLVFAKTCLASGWKVSVISRSGSLSDPEIHFHAADIRDESQFSKAIKKLCKENGPISSIAFFQRARGSGDLWAEHMETSVRSIDMAVTASLPHFKSSGDKSVLIAASISSLFVAPEQNAAYHASRSAQIGLMRHLAVSLGPTGIRVNAISMGTLLKPENIHFFPQESDKRMKCEAASPLHRMGSAQEVAMAAEFLCSEKASWITGQNIVCDGGASLIWPESR